MSPLFEERMNDQKLKSAITKAVEHFANDGVDILSHKMSHLFERFGEDNDDMIASYTLIGALTAAMVIDRAIRAEEIEFLASVFPSVDIRKVIEHFKVHPFNIELLAPTLSKTQRMTIYLLVWQICLSDNEMHAKEKQYLNNMKRIFELNDEELRDYKFALFAELA